MRVIFLNAGQLLKQRWLESLQTLGSLSKYDGDKRDREQHIGLNYQNNNLICTRITFFCPWPLLHDYGLKCLTSYAGSKQQATIFFSFFLLKTSLLEFISRKIAIISKIERGGIKAMWLSIYSHMLEKCKILPAVNFGEL